MATKLWPALAAGLLLFHSACSDDYVQPPPPTGSTPAPDAGALDPSLAPQGTLAVTATAEVDVPTGRRSVLHASVTGGAGPYRVAWLQTGGPPQVLTRADSLEPELLAGTSAGDAVYLVSAVDATGALATAPVTVHLVADGLATQVSSNRVLEDASETTLHAALSGNLDGTTFVWRQTKGPPVTLVSPTSPTTRVVIPFLGPRTLLEFEARATSDPGGVAAATATVEVRPRGPRANAGVPQVASENVAFTLRGSAHDGTGPYRFAWTQTAGAAVTLTAADTDAPSFTAPAGEYTFALALTDADDHVGTDTVAVSVLAAAAPALTANLGANGSAFGGERIQLSAAGQGGTPPYTYTFEQTAGTAVTLASPSAAARTFDAPAGATSLAFKLTVTDGAGGTATDTVTYDVETRTIRVDAGGDLVVAPADFVRLGAATELGSGARTWAWTQIAGPAVTLAGAATANPSFTAAEVLADTDLGFRVTATDASGSGTDEVTVRVHPASPFAASAGGAQVVAAGDRVLLNGIGANGAPPYRYVWTQSGGTPAALAMVDGPTPSFTAPIVFADEDLLFALTVSDPFGRSATANVTVSVRALDGGRPETFDAGRLLTASERTILMCDGPDCYGGGERVVCDPRAPFALTTLGASGNGGITVRKRCTSHTPCLRDWWKESSGIDVCASLLPPTNLPLDALANNGGPVTCNYCCAGADCNTAFVPAVPLQCPGDVCYPLRTP